MPKMIVALLSTVVLAHGFAGLGESVNLFGGVNELTIDTSGEQRSQTYMSKNRTMQLLQKGNCDHGSGFGEGVTIHLDTNWPAVQMLYGGGPAVTHRCDPNATSWGVNVWLKYQDCFQYLNSPTNRGAEEGVLSPFAFIEFTDPTKQIPCTDCSWIGVGSTTNAQSILNVNFEYCLSTQGEMNQFTGSNINLLWGTASSTLPGPLA